MATNAAILALCGTLVIASGTRYLGDAGYIIEQASVLHDTGRALYTQLEFAYGPLLLWPEIWISRFLGCQMPMAYFMTLVIESSLGLVLLAYVLNQIPTRSYLRRWMFVLLVLAGLTPHLGLNYTYLRFASPLAVLLFATQERHMWRCATLLAFGEVVELLISPELAGVLAVGAVTFALLRALQSGWDWLLAGICPVAALFGFMCTLGKPYLQMASSFARGSLNLPVGPYPHVLILLVALVWIVPFGLGMYRSWSDPDSTRMIALYAASLTFMQSALGRCDPVHVVFSGVGMFALSLLCFREPSYRRLRTAWLTSLIVMVVWSQYVNQRFFQMRSANVLSVTVLPYIPGSMRSAVIHFITRKSPVLGEALSVQRVKGTKLMMQRIASVAGSNCVSTPLDVGPELESQLKSTRQYHPGYYAFWVDMMSPAAEQRSIYNINKCPFMLVPEHPIENPHTLATLSALQGVYLPYRPRNHSLYNPGLTFKMELKRNWKVLFSEDSYLLLESRQFMSK